MRPISDVATDLGLAAGDLSGGSTWTKVPIRPTPSMPRGMGRYVLVTGTTPTGAGEGKTVTAIGLAMALVRAGNRAVVTLRQSSFGPTLGQKGGGAGGGAATIEPLDAAILGLGADQFAVETANNLLAARLDDLLWRGEVALDADQVWWRRVLDIRIAPSDRQS